MNELTPDVPLPELYSGEGNDEVFCNFTPGRRSGEMITSQSVCE